MKDLINDTPVTDDFDLIELGSVSEETKGIGQVEEEFAGGPNTRL